MVLVFFCCAKQENYVILSSLYHASWQVCAVWFELHEYFLAAFLFYQGPGGGPAERTAVCVQAKRTAVQRRL
jgi:hypothetical protein